METDKTQTPTTGGTITPEHGDPHTDTSCSSRSGKESGHSASSEERPLAKLKLKLPDMPTKPLPDAPALRRSGRTSETTAKHDSASIGRGAPLSKTMPKGKKTLQSKLARSSAVIEIPQPQRKLANVYTEHAEEESLHGITKSTSTPRRENTSLHIPPGNPNDPIDVDALPSPPPHRFINRSASYYAPLPLQYRPSRPNMPPVLFTPNGAEITSGRVSGHQSHDIYTSYVERKDAPTPPGFVNGYTSFGTGAFAGMPRSKRPISSVNIHPAYVNEYEHANARVVGQPYAAPLQTRYQSHAHDYRAYTASYHTPIHGYPVFPIMNEGHLRQRAVQFVLDHSRPRSRKRRLSDDPDETSNSEYEDAEEQPKKKTKNSQPVERPTTSSQPSDEVVVSTPSTGASEEDMFDRNLKLAELVEHMQLLTALLMTYPRSVDQNGMREDITILSTVTDKRLASWVSAEEAFDGDTRQRLASAASSLANLTDLPNTISHSRKESAAQVAMQAEETAKKQQEDEIREYLSADSSVWAKEARQMAGAQGSGSSGQKDDDFGRNDSAFEAGDGAPSVQDAVVPIVVA